MRYLALLPLFAVACSAEPGSVDAAVASDAETSGAADGSRDDGQGDGDEAGDGDVLLAGGTARFDAGMPPPGTGTGTASERLLALQWTGLTWTPADCKVQLATDLSMLDPLVWKPASGTAAACSTLNTEALLSDYGYGDSAGGNQLAYPIDPDGGRPLPTERAEVFYDARGAPKFAFRYGAGCTRDRVLNGEETCWSFRSLETRASDASTLGCGGELTAPAQVFRWDGLAGSWAVSDKLVVATRVGSTMGVVFDRDQPSAAPTALSSQWSGADRLEARGSTILTLAMYTEAGEYRQRFLRSESFGQWQTLYDPKPRVIWNFAVHGDQIAWLEADSLLGTESRQTSLHLGTWPAPGAALSGKQLAVITNARDDAFLLRDDYLARTTVSDVRLHRLSDQKEWIVPLPAGLKDGLYTRLWLDDTYLTYTASDTPPGMPSTSRVLVRCPIAEIVKGASL